MHYLAAEESLRLLRRHNAPSGPATRTPSKATMNRGGCCNRLEKPQPRHIVT